MTGTPTYLIGGERVSAEAPLASVNPSNTADIVARYPAGGAAEVDVAVEAGRGAFPKQGFAAVESCTRTKTVYVA